MATTLIGTAATLYTHSITTTQTGMNVESWSASVEPEFYEELMDITGHETGGAVGDLVTTLTITGETIRSSGGGYLGVLLDSFSADATSGVTLGNNVPAGGPTTEFLKKSAEITQTRGSFETGTTVYRAVTNMTI